MLLVWEQSTKMVDDEESQIILLLYLVSILSHDLLLSLAVGPRKTHNITAASVAVCSAFSTGWGAATVHSKV